MKRLICVLLVICILMFAVGCASGGVTEEDFAVKVGGETIELGMPSVYKGEEVIPDVGGPLAKMGVTGMSKDDMFFWLVINGEEASLGCGLKVGDNVSEVIKVLGKNIMHDEDQSESEYEILYYYYVKNGKLYGIADTINIDRLSARIMNEEEEKYFEKIKDDYMYHDAYTLQFYITDNIVSWMELMHIDNSDRRDE
jgi:hypothetical protein